MDWAKYQNRLSSKRIWVTKLVFCLNDSSIGGSFWKKDSLITQILFELLICLFWKSNAGSNKKLNFKQHSETRVNVKSKIYLSRIGFRAFPFLKLCHRGYANPKLCNQVPSLDHFVVQNSGDFLCWKYKEVLCFLCFKLETIVSYWEEYCESVQSWLLSQA